MQRGGTPHSAPLLVHKTELLRSTGAEPSSLLAVPTDVTDPAQVEALREKTYAAFGKCHFLFLNAGIGGGGGPIPNDLRRWRSVVEVNLFGVLNGLAAFANPMIRQSTEEGVDCVIAMTGSRAGITTPPGDTSYTVSKAALQWLR